MEQNLGENMNADNTMMSLINFGHKVGEPFISAMVVDGRIEFRGRAMSPREHAETQVLDYIVDNLFTFKSIQELNIYCTGEPCGKCMSDILWTVPLLPEVINVNIVYAVDRDTLTQIGSDYQTVKASDVLKNFNLQGVKVSLVEHIKKNEAINLFKRYQDKVK